MLLWLLEMHTKYVKGCALQCNTKTWKLPKYLTIDLLGYNRSTWLKNWSHWQPHYKEYLTAPGSGYDVSLSGKRKQAM